MRRLFVKTTFAEPVDLTGKRIVVTGAGPRSLGFATAKILADWGATVTVTTRADTEAVVEALRAELPNGAADHIEGHSLDLSDRESVDRFVRWLIDKHERLDVLINNAGVHLDLLSRWKEPRLTADGVETHWRVNYLGTAHLTRRLLPLLRKTGEATGDARVVTVGSQIYAKGSNVDIPEPTRPYNSWTAYATSKLALMHMTSELQRRFASTSNLQAYCLHPGSVYTRDADKGLEGAGLIEKVRGALAPVEAFFLKTPEEGAQTQIHCATKPGLRGDIYFTECQPTPTTEDARDSEVARRLWDETEIWIGGRGHWR
ncbi:MAG: SDR family NAD(P)-dependent oxidoreductase [Myxococcales bacterium]|nr:MAG: SDR family NAD(P)-dependent oxidoreductase [Myxococcales bacterium]